MIDLIMLKRQKRYYQNTSENSLIWNKKHIVTLKWLIYK